MEPHAGFYTTSRDVTEGGSELCQQVVQFEPRELIVLDNNETGLHDLELALRARSRQLSVSIVVPDVTDARRMEAESATVDRMSSSTRQPTSTCR